MHSLYKADEVGNDGAVFSFGGADAIVIACRVPTDFSAADARRVTTDIGAQVRSLYGAATKCRVRFNYCLRSGSRESYQIPEPRPAVSQADGATDNARE